MCISGWDFVAALSDWGIFFKLGIPGILMIAFEEWCLEISTFVAGRFHSSSSSFIKSNQTIPVSFVGLFIIYVVKFLKIFKSHPVSPQAVTEIPEL